MRSNKNYLFWIYLVCFVGFSHAQSSADTTDGLSFSERISIYDNAKIETGLPSLLASTVGLGSGSFAQGDLIGGSAGFLLDIAAYSGLGMALSYGDQLTATSSWYVTKRDELASSKTGWAIVGCSILIASRLFQFICPQLFADDHNRKLRRALNLDFPEFK